jgi:hypothetical protein
MSGKIHRMIFFPIDSPKKFLRENMPHKRPSDSVLAAMKKDQVARVSAIHEFCIDEEGRCANYGIGRGSGYNDWDSIVGTAIMQSWRKAFVVEGFGVRICDAVELVYPTPP